MEVVKRDTLQAHIKSLAQVLTETLRSGERDADASSRGLNDLSETATEEDDDECRVYYETICSSHSNDILDNDCKRIPVRLCAQGCIIQEGEMKCKRTNNPAIRKIPLEKCEIKPQTVCRKLTKLVPKLIAKVSRSLCIFLKCDFLTYIFLEYLSEESN